EICDGKDNDCDGVADQGCDFDGDGWCDKDKTVIGKPTSCPKGGGDCDDGNKSVYPGAPELCDGKDNNCKSGVDEGCDDDGDGWCDSKMKMVGNPAVCFKGGGDCADTDPSTNPGAAETCDNKDNNCKSGADEGCDDDGDGWCDSKMKVVGTPKVCPKGGGDCCDIDTQAQPKVSGWFKTTNKCGSWDYNCSGTAEKRWTVKANPGHKTSGLNWECFANPAGWKNSTPPNCGVSASWVYDFTWNGNFTIPFVNSCKKKEYKPQTQECH
ncbi:MAG TPA: hypothetical protein DCQ06_12280, partial [Myxococcales bacterium]|nr:hypothetical protein [Myxococcales bacterium]